MDQSNYKESLTVFYKHYHDKRKQLSQYLALVTSEKLQQKKISK